MTRHAVVKHFNGQEVERREYRSRAAAHNRYDAITEQLTFNPDHHLWTEGWAVALWHFDEKGTWFSAPFACIEEPNLNQKVRK